MLARAHHAVVSAPTATDAQGKIFKELHMLAETLMHHVLCLPCLLRFIQDSRGPAAQVIRC